MKPLSIFILLMSLSSACFAHDTRLAWTLATVKKPNLQLSWIEDQGTQSGHFETCWNSHCRILTKEISTEELPSFLQRVETLIAEKAARHNIPLIHSPHDFTLTFRDQKEVLLFSGVMLATLAPISKAHFVGAIAAMAVSDYFTHRTHQAASRHLLRVTDQSLALALAPNHTPIELDKKAYKFLIETISIAMDWRPQKNFSNF